MTRVKPIEWVKLKFGEGEGGYSGRQFIGMIKRSSTEAGKFQVVCPFRRIEELFPDIESGRDRLMSQFRVFMEAVTGDTIEIHSCTPPSHGK